MATEMELVRETLHIHEAYTDTGAKVRALRLVIKKAMSMGDERVGELELELIKVKAHAFELMVELSKLKYGE